MKYDVFISYRRDGGDTLSQLLYDRLTQRGYRVFFDIESLNSGKFNEKLLEVIEECKDMIIVLPPNALDRCHDEEDWLYKELYHGMKHKKNIVPVLMKNFVWPDDIPEEIAEIKNYNGIIDNKDYFDAVIEKITTLLISKPVRGGNFINRANKKKQTLKEKAKQRKRMLLGVAVGVLCLAGVFAFVKYNQEQKKIKEETTVTIRLTPSENMNASEYYEAIEILEERVKILAGESEYSLDNNKDEIVVQLPVDVFHETKVNEVLDGYICSPAKLYLSSGAAVWEDDELTEDEYFLIDSSDIESVEVVQRKLKNIDAEALELTGIDGSDEYSMFAMKLKDGVMEEAMEWIHDKEWKAVHIYQDIDKIDFYDVTYYLVDEFTKDGVIYFLNEFSDENMINLFEYNCVGGTFSEVFAYDYKLPVKWEYDDQEVVFGEKQCNIDDLEGNLARYEFGLTFSEDDYSEGEYQDIISSFKKRLDAIGAPYAMGYDPENKCNIKIETDPAYWNKFVCDNFSENYKLSVFSNFYEVMDSFYVESIEVKQNEEGYYSIELTPDEYWQSYQKEVVTDEMSPETEVYLALDGLSMFGLDKSTISEAFDGEKFVFDGLSFFDVEKVDGDQKYIFDFCKSFSELDNPGSFELSNVYMEDREEVVEYILADPVLDAEVEAEYRKILDSIDLIEEYDIKVQSTAQDIDIHLLCSKGSDYVKTVHSIFEQIYQKADIASGKSESVTIEFRENVENYRSIYFNLRTDRYNQGISFNANYYLDENDPRCDELDAMINSNALYDQFIVSEYYMDNGKISFK